jgi:hypothetical protein
LKQDLLISPYITKQKQRKAISNVVLWLHHEDAGNHQNASADWCFGECLLLLEAVIERPIELLLMAEIGNARA